MGHQRILIDTSILIDHFRKIQKNKTIFFQYSTRFNYVISSFTEFEFLIGSSPVNREYVEKLLSKLSVLASNVIIQILKDIRIIPLVLLDFPLLHNLSM